MSVRKLCRIAKKYLTKKEYKRVRYALLISLLVIMPILYAGIGHFLFSERAGPDSGAETHPSKTGTLFPESGNEAESSVDIADFVKHISRSEVINGEKQEINILEVDLSSPMICIRPVLSHDLIYGFEKLSIMAERKNAYAAVNGGFFHQYGLPSGMVVTGGELISASTGKYPVFIVDEGKAELKEIKNKLEIEYKRDDGTAAGDKIHVDLLNSPVSGKGTAVYTPVYGIYNRAEKSNITVKVEDGIVTDIAFYNGEAEIPRNGMLITFFDIEKYAGKDMPLKVGDSVKLTYGPYTDGDADAYECGCWLVKDGNPVVPLQDPWIGTLTNRDPRTAVGIKDDGTVILLTVDGRQPGYSAGFTGKELAGYLISCGVKNAAMLDGGASTEMIVDGKLVSRPSYKGEERDLGGGLLVLLEASNQ